MGWISDRGAVLAAAWKEKRYLLPSLMLAVSAVVGLAVAGLKKIGVEIDWLLPWFAALVVALFLGALWILEYTVTLRKQISGTRVGLSELRQEGVKIRNDGITPFPDKSTWEDWRVLALDWNKRVINKIKEINEADGVWFETLDVVPSPRINLYLKEEPELWQDDRIKLYGEHDCRLKRLGEMIRNLWRD